MTTPAGIEKPLELDDDDSLLHYVCICDKNLALCGARVADSEWTDDDNVADMCLVCYELDGYPCKRCGL